MSQKGLGWRAKNSHNMLQTCFNQRAKTKECARISLFCGVALVSCWWWRRCTTLKFPAPGFPQTASTHTQRTVVSGSLSVTHSLNAPSNSNRDIFTLKLTQVTTSPHALQIHHVPTGLCVWKRPFAWDSTLNSGVKHYISLKKRQNKDEEIKRDRECVLQLK